MYAHAVSSTDLWGITISKDSFGFRTDGYKRYNFNIIPTECFSVDDLKRRQEFSKSVQAHKDNSSPALNSTFRLINGWEISINYGNGTSVVKCKIRKSRSPTIREVLPQFLNETTAVLKVEDSTKTFRVRVPKVFSYLVYQDISWSSSFDGIPRDAIYTFTKDSFKYYIQITSDTEYNILVHQGVNAFDDGNGNHANDNHANDDHANQPDNKTVGDPEAAISPEVKMGLGVLSIFVILSILYYQARVRRAAIGKKPEEPVRPNSPKGSSKFKGSNPRRLLPKRQ